MSLEIDTRKIFKKSIVNNEEDNMPNNDHAPYPYVNEEDLIHELEDEFDYQIKERGKDYYNSGNVLKVCKSGNKYYAKVNGSSDKPYKVTIENDLDDGIDFNCDCPYEFPCKHIYAVLLSISNQEYETIELKPEIREKKSSLQSLIELIPAEELKKYILSPIGLDFVSFEITNFEDYFRKYLPKQTYEYYYNNLYNELILGHNKKELIDNYINRAKQYVDSNDFSESFIILKSIIEAYNDSNILNSDEYIIDILPKIGMLLRISYRKCDDITKKSIDEWIKNIEKDNYYNNYYLEDIVLFQK